MLTQEQRDFIRQFAPNIVLAGGLGAEQWRPAGFQDSIRFVQMLDMLGYPGWGFTEQTQSWVFRSIWPMMELSKELPEFEAFYDTFLLIAAIGPQTKKIRFITKTDCYRRPPSVMAQMMLTLDHITQGRVGVYIGTGENKQFTPYGLERSLPRNERLEEYIRVTRALIRANEPISLEGKFWPLKDALMALPPYDAANPPKVMIVGGGPAAMKIAGRVADGLGTYLPGAYANIPDAFAADLAIMHAEARDAGRDPASLPISSSYCTVLCENDQQITRALESPYIRAFVLNLTPTGEHWHKWNSQHPLGDKWALSQTHRSTLFSKQEMIEIMSKVSDRDVQQMIYVGTPEDVAARMVPWFRIMGYRTAPLGSGGNFGNVLFPEQRQLAEDGLPRWHHLQLRFVAEANRRLARQ